MTRAQNALRRALLAVTGVGALALTMEAVVVAAFFATAPDERPNPIGELAPARSGAVTIVALADVHARPGVLFEAFADAQKREAAAILIGGDLADRNSELEYRWGATLLA